MQARSAAGSITIKGGLVSISRASLPGLSPPVRTVAITDLVGLELRQASAFEPGYIRLIYPGAESGLAAKVRIYDPDTIMFNIEHQQDMLEAHDALMTMIRGAPYITPQPKPTQLSGLAIIILITGILVGVGLLAGWILS